MKNTGKKIQTYAKVFFTLNIILVIFGEIVGFYMLFNYYFLDSTMKIEASALLVLCGVVLFVFFYFGYLLLVGYGKIVETSEYVRSVDFSNLK